MAQLKTESTVNNNEILHAGNSAVIIDSGSDSNGNWIKWSNGRMLCWKNGITWTSGETNSNGSYSYYRGVQTWAFPQTFSSAPMGFASTGYRANNGYGGWASVPPNNISTTSCSIILGVPYLSYSVSTLKFNVFVIGDY